MREPYKIYGKLMDFVEEVLQRNNLVYGVLPPRWVFGLPIGNGEVGGMVWVRDDTQLIITLDHVWAWDNRSHPLNDPDRFNYHRSYAVGSSV